ncbi:MAG: MarC family protein [Tepidisphaeraceae bacterium]|jgi:multiple antibiotic resistance protein
MLDKFVQVFLPLFVALDPIGMVPLFLAVTVSLDTGQRKRIAVQAVLTATLIAIGFMFVGQVLFTYLGISSADFRIAGGVLLLVFAVLDVAVSGKPAVHEPDIVGLVPLATPLIAGPATLTTILVLSSQAGLGRAWTAAGLLVNFVVLAFMLRFADVIGRVVGVKPMSAVAKVITVLLAAIAVNFIRLGVTEIVHQWK